MNLGWVMLLACCIAGSIASAQDESVAEPPAETPAELPPNVDLKSAANTPLTLSVEVRTIVGLSAGTKGGGIGLRADVEQLNKAIADVGAKVSPIEIRVELPGDVLFDFDKTNLKPVAEETLRKVATIIKARSKGTVQINGYTDSKGSDAYNLRLSDGRARSVKDWLSKNAAVPAASMSTKGFGEANPVAPNEKPNGADNPEGRARNRRVELIIPTR